MDAKRIQDIQKGTAHPDSTSVANALFQVWNEVQQESNARVAALESQLLAAVQRAEEAELELALEKKERTEETFLHMTLEREQRDAAESRATALAARVEALEEELQDHADDPHCQLKPSLLLTAPHAGEKGEAQ